VHTENEQSKPDTTKRMGKPGEQVAVNRTTHCNMQLFENEAGEYYPVVDVMEKVSLVRGEYIPIGNRFHYPKVWGRKYAAVKLLEHKIQVERNIIEGAQKELAKLERCLSGVKEWPDTE